MTVAPPLVAPTVGADLPGRPEAAARGDFQAALTAEVGATRPTNVEAAPVPAAAEVEDVDGTVPDETAPDGSAIAVGPMVVPVLVQTPSDATSASGPPPKIERAASLALTSESPLVRIEEGSAPPPPSSEVRFVSESPPVSGEPVPSSEPVPSGAPSSDEAASSETSAPAPPSSLPDLPARIGRAADSRPVAPKPAAPTVTPEPGAVAAPPEDAGTRTEASPSPAPLPEVVRVPGTAPAPAAPESRLQAEVAVRLVGEEEVAPPSSDAGPAAESEDGPRPSAPAASSAEAPPAAATSAEPAPRPEAVGGPSAPERGAQPHPPPSAGPDAAAPGAPEELSAAGGPASTAPLPPATPAETGALVPEADPDSAPAPDLPEAAAPETTPDVAVPSAQTTAPPPEAPGALPARLAAPVWVNRLDVLAAGQHSVEVALDDGDGTVHLQTRRDGEGLSVVVRFSDPELGALAGVHARQIAEALEAHFAEPVRLAVGDHAADGGSSGDRTPHDARPQTPRTASTEAAPSSDAPAPRSLGRREWVG